MTSRRAYSGPQISSPHNQQALSPSTCVRWPNDTGADRGGGGGSRKDGGGVWGDAARGPRDPGLPRASPCLAPGRTRGRTHAHPPAPVREDGRFCLDIKALCCTHTKASKTRFSSRPFGQIEGTQLNFQRGPQKSEAIGGLPVEGEQQASRPHLPKSVTIQVFVRGAGAEIFVREEGNYFYYQGPNGVLNIHVLVGFLPLNRVQT